MSDGAPEGAKGAHSALPQGWARSLPGRVVRDFGICVVFDAIVSAYARREVAGAQQLQSIARPAIFVANHSSHIDTPVLLRSLPGAWRRRTLVAAAADYFYANPLLAGAVALAFGTVPVQRRGGGAGGTDAIAGLARLLGDGWSLVVFAQGTRSRDGRIARLRAGAAMLAAEYRLPIVPVHIAGTRAAMPVGRRWPARPSGRGLRARHPVEVRFGEPIEVSDSDDSREVMERVRLFFEACGAETTPDRRLAARRAAAAAAEAKAAEAKAAEESPEHVVGAAADTAPVLEARQAPAGERGPAAVEAVEGV